MKQRKYVVITLVMVMAFMAMSVGSVLAGDFDKSTPLPDEGHAPVCSKSSTDNGFVLECFDVDEDIAKVEVVSNGKYELQWNASRVMLRVQATGLTEVAFWTVKDMQNHVVSGHLP
jgi:hypothetical protein